MNNDMSTFLTGINMNTETKPSTKYLSTDARDARHGSLDNLGKHGAGS